MKKKAIVSILLCLTLVFCGVMSAFAADRTPEDIAADARMIPVTLDDGRDTIYIRIAIEGEPEILKLSTCIKVARLLYERQQAEYGDSDLALMSERHILGELTMHMIAYCLFKSLGGAEEGSPFHENYERSVVADLNIDEDRVPGIEAVGALIQMFEMFAGVSNSMRG